MSEIWIPAGYVVGYFDIEYDDGIIGHHGGHVKKGIGGVDNPEDSIGPNRVLDSVHQKDKTTLQQVVQDDKAEKGYFWQFFSTYPPLCINQLLKKLNGWIDGC